MSGSRPSTPGHTAHERIGRGAFGEVWRATDDDTGEALALKWIDAGRIDPRRIEREIRSLHHLDVPGVVRLRGWGEADGAAWIAMDLAVGVPFPGMLPPTWSAVRHAVGSLLDALSGLHAAGVVHRDLKPANVLVDEDGRASVLDLGLARGRTSGGTFTASGTVLGTPRYLSPEVARGGRADPRSDLHAVALMAVEAMTGRVPHDSDDPVVGIARRAREEVPPLDLEAPPHVVRTLQAMLRSHPDERPPTARAVIRLLSGVGARVGPMPWLGPEEPLVVSARRLAAGHPVAVSGPSGSGRSRWTTEVVARSRRVGVWASPGTRPYESLRALLPEGTIDAGAPARLTEAVGALGASGTCLVVDPIEAIDPWSLKLLEACPEAPIVTAGSEPNGVRITALTAGDLSGLFAGPERLFHLVSDAAAAVITRTGGLPGAVVAELDAWVDRGLATWRAGRLEIDRVDLERLNDEPPGGLGPPEPPADELLRWVGRAGPRVSTAALARARGESEFSLVLQLESLEGRGLVRRRHPGWEAVGRPWSDPSRDHRVHAALADALPIGDPDRVAHLVAADRPEAGAEVGSAVRTLWLEGRAAAAVGLAEAATRRSAPPTWDLVSALATMTWADRDGAVARRARAAAARLDLPPDVSGLVAARPEPGDGPIADERLEVLRRDLRITAAKGEGRDRWSTEVAASAAWAEAQSSAEIRARAFGWRADLAYATARLDEAAALAEQAGREAPGVIDALGYLFRAATVRLEQADVHTVRALATEIASRAAALRLPRAEARGEMLLRLLAERTRTASGVDAELIEAAAHLGDPVLAGHLWLVEARIAWAGGSFPVGLRLANRAVEAWAGPALAAARLCARAVAIACGDPAPIQPILAELERLDRPDVDVEVIGLLAFARRLPEGPWESRIERAISRLPGYPRDWPHGAFSVVSTLTLLRSPLLENETRPHPPLDPPP